MTVQPETSDQAREIFLAVEDALHSLPQEQVPPRFTVNLMRQVGQVAQPRFRLTWMDLALSLFAASMLGVTGLVVGVLPPYFDVYLHQAAYYWFQSITLHPETLPLAITMVVLAVSAACTAGLAAMQIRK